MNTVPAPARSSTPGAVCPPDSVPNNTCSAPSPRNVLEISVTNGRDARGLGIVDETRERFTAGAGLADQQHGRIVRRDLREIGAQLLHDAAAAHRHARRRG